jgi:choline-sulfatase
MRFPPIYESNQLKAFRARYLKTQNFLRLNGVDFQRHYAASVACSPSRGSLFTGQYPSLHGVTQTTGAAKDAFDSDVFWLDPATVPTFGDYFRAAGYSTYWKGKWHASHADMVVPGTHSQILSYDPTNGAPDTKREAQYLTADRLGRFGFSGWIGPEPHGSEPLNSGSSVPSNEQGRDLGFAQQAANLIRELDHDKSAAPWLVVSSFVNPHDITLWGLWANLGGNFVFDIEDVVPEELFEDLFFDQTVADDLDSKPQAQKSYRDSYAQWMQPILDDDATLELYYRYYYQLHKNVDERMMEVLRALLASRYADNTYVIFTSDHGDLLGSHNGMHQKWYTAYDEALRVPLIVWHKNLASVPRTVDDLTSHVDIAPTLLGLAGVDPEPLRAKLSIDHSDARPLVGRNLAPLVLGTANPAEFEQPLYFMTDDDPSRGPNQDNWVGITVNSVIQPNHLETVIAQLDGPGGRKVWKYTRYFDNPQFWSSPGTPPPTSGPGASATAEVEDVVIDQLEPTPTTDGTQPLACNVTVKHVPVADEFEMYNVTDDPMELENLWSKTSPLPEQAVLAALLVAQCAEKRLTPCSGDVPGQPDCGQGSCVASASAVAPDSGSRS